MQILAVGLGWGARDCSQGCPCFWFQDDSFEYQGANKLLRKTAFSVGLQYGNRKSVGLSLRGLPVNHEAKSLGPESRLPCILNDWVHVRWSSILAEENGGQSWVCKPALWGKKHLCIPRWWQWEWSGSSASDKSYAGWLLATRTHMHTHPRMDTRTHACAHTRRARAG